MTRAHRVTPAEIMAECNRQLETLSRHQANYPAHAASIDQRIAEIQAIRRAWFASKGTDRR